jgi:hypothetical protein
MVLVGKAPIGTHPTGPAAASPAQDRGRQIKRRTPWSVVSRVRPRPEAAPIHPHSRIAWLRRGAFGKAFARCRGGAL